jgi:hypothetical protein
MAHEYQKSGYHKSLISESLEINPTLMSITLWMRHNKNNQGWINSSTLQLMYVPSLSC